MNQETPENHNPLQGSAHRQTFSLGEQSFTLETGRIARQATGAVMVSVGDTRVLATVVLGRVIEDAKFLPLTVQYQERFYATGRIPGSFFRREGRPSEKEVLTSRLIDRPIRPLFPKSCTQEIQLICTVMSAERKQNTDIAAMIGASAALAVAGAPCSGVISAVRVGYDIASNQYLLNPSDEQLQSSSLDMVVAGGRGGVLMVESEASQLSEELMLGAVLFAQNALLPALDAIEALAKDAGAQAPPMPKPSLPSDALLAAIEACSGDALRAACANPDKKARNRAFDELRETAHAALAAEYGGEALSTALQYFQRSEVRRRILDGEPRIDGRDARTVRPIETEVGLLPGTHGSSMFTRGETQAIAVTTLGGARDAQIVDSLEGREDDPFMLHYNFPPYSVGESRRMMPPSRREIGHGRLARRALTALLPSPEAFPYTLRVVSEITESNGSSSMATVCASSLALMDAGVPLAAPVAGIAMGLVSDGDRSAVLTDILGDEDHLGDMDFKVAGTATGITALQMDIKIDGLEQSVLEQALAQAHEARLHILEQMALSLSAPRERVASKAPQFEIVRIPENRVRDLIGRGGSTVRGITDDTGANIDINQDGTVRVYAESREVLEQAVARIKSVTVDVEVGGIYEGTVVSLQKYGAFVNIMPGRDGLVHASEVISSDGFCRVEEHLEEGQKVRVKVLEVDDRGKVRLSMKALEGEGGA